MKIQNKYVFRTIISECLYFLKMTHGSGMVAKPMHLGHVRTTHKSSMAARPKALESDMVWENHCRLRDILLWIVIVVSLLISHLFARSFFGFLFFSQRMGGVRAIKEAPITLFGGQIWSSVVSLDAQPCPLLHGVTHVDR